MNDGGSDPVDWSQFYQHMASGSHNRSPQSFTDTSVSANSTARPPMPISIVDVAASSGSRGRTARKRSRTSRRAPTTLLNTDTSNFRALVQQYTGVPSAPYTTSYMPSGATTLNFGIGFNNSVSRATIPPSFGVVETRQNQYQYHHQQQQQQQQHHQERYMLSQQNQYRRSPEQEEMIGFRVDGNMEDDRNQVLENSREVGLGLPEEFFLDGIGGQVNPRQPSENNRGGGPGGYFL